MFDYDSNLISTLQFSDLKGITRNGFVVELNKKWGVINESGAFIIEPKYDNFESAFGNENYLVSKDGLSGIIDLEEKIIFPLKYEKLKKVGYSDIDGYIVKSGNQYGYINLNTGGIIEPEYDQIRQSFGVEGGSGGFLLSKKNGKSGLIFMTGELIALPLFDKIEKVGYRQGNITWLVENKNFAFVINHRGECIEGCPSKDHLEAMGF